jgi:L-iditol 2-dehydrogenase
LEVTVKVLFGKSPFQLQWRDAPVPKPQSGQVLVRIEAGGICGTDLHFLRNNEDWTPLGHEVVVFGPGPIGLMVVRLAKLQGARRVFLVGSKRSTPRGAYRLELGKQMGADLILCYEENDVVGEILNAIPKGADRVIVTAPPKTITDAIQVSRFGGIVAFNGIEYGEGSQITFDANEFHFKKLQLRASHAIPNHYFPIAIDLLNRHDLPLEALLSHVFPFNEAEKAFQIASSQQEKVLKVVLKS